MLEIVSVRSAIPGSVAERDVLAVEHEVLVDLVGDAHQIVLDARGGDRLELRAPPEPVPSDCAAS